MSSSQRAAWVSVIMPARNAASVVGAAISGVLTQTHPEVELLVVDDGSTDETVRICAAYGGRITLLRGEHRGVAGARNAAIARASGDFIAFCDSDDVLLARYLEAGLAAYEAGGGGRRIVMSNALLLTINGIAHRRELIGKKCPVPERQRMAILQKNFVPIFALFPRSLIGEVGDFDPQRQYCEDWDLWIRAVLAGWRVLYQPVPHALYRWSPDSLSTHPGAQKAEHEMITSVRERFWGELNDEERAYITLREQVGAPRNLDRAGTDAIRRGDFDEARQVFRRLEQVSSQDRRLLYKARAIGRLPGAAQAWRWRQARIDAATGRTDSDNR